MDLLKLKTFIIEVDKLKKVQRAAKTYHEDRLENSAEHSWHLALATLSFGMSSNKDLDLLKCLKMALLHDLVEIDAGDTIVYAEDPGKYERELEAAKQIFSLLPNEIGEDFLAIWIEFEKKESEEAKLVAALDRFLPLNSNLVNKANSWKPHNITKEQVYQKNKKDIEAGVPGLWQEITADIDNIFENYMN